MSYEDKSFRDLPTGQMVTAYVTTFAIAVPGGWAVAEVLPVGGYASLVAFAWTVLIARLASRVVYDALVRHERGEDA